MAAREIAARNQNRRVVIFSRLIAQHPGLKGWDLYSHYLKDREGQQLPVSDPYIDLRKVVAAGAARVELLGPRKAHHYYPTEGR